MSTASASPVLWASGLLAAILYGISIGSFLNVVIYRLPRGQSVAKPTWSYCPNCEHRLSTADLIPLFSFLALGRKCRYCKQPISWRYFGVEALTGILFVIVYLSIGPTIDVIFDIVFVSLLICIFFIDLEQFIIPDELSALGVALGFAHNVYGIVVREPKMWTELFGVNLPSSIPSAVICAIIFHMISFFGLLYYASASGAKGNKVAQSAGKFVAGIFDDYAYLFLKFLGFGIWLPAARKFIQEREVLLDEDGAASERAEVDPQTGQLKSREEIATELENDEEQTGMGQGDAKLAAMIGANLLLSLSLVSFFLAVLSGTIVGVSMMIAQRKTGRTAIPFGPFMAVGALLSLLFGHSLIHWYRAYAHI